jgi:septal ring factor EnvC (AmiA/AmiB activator)
MTEHRRQNVGKEKDELIRKLQVAKDKLAEADANLAKVEVILAPLTMQLADIQRERKYLQMRIDKLADILAKA